MSTTVSFPSPPPSTPLPMEALLPTPSPVFHELAGEIHPQTVLRADITAAYRRSENEAVAMLLESARLPQAQASKAQALASRLATRLRERKTGSGRAGLVQGLIQEFSLSSQEGVALMCLAEALLRIPDAATRDALIRDKIGDADWRSHLGQSGSMFVNAATWGLVVTGKLVATHTEDGLGKALTRLIGKGGEPLIRKGVDMAMRMMGEQFVTGQDINEALANARRREREGFRYSYDMLGEAALTEEDAHRYLQSYETAIHAIGKASAGRGIYEGPGISIKLSALHPRYARAQFGRVMGELYPRLLSLSLLAKRYDIGLNIDAEEADRLEISLDLLEKLCFEPELAGWNGIGFVVQAYQKRCPHVLDFLVDLARRSRRRLMVRLVKGAYWDSEIKRAQIDGLEGYPVYTRKAYTDISYLACARRLLSAPEAIYPQFATHNAHTLAAIHETAGLNYYAGQYEFQCLHGMGEPLYEQVVATPGAGGLGRPCRIYAPVGTHETLLAYLVRRLLENGANTSFVNRIADDTLSIDALVEDPVETVERMAANEGQLGLPHPAIPMPRALYGTARANSRGLDLSNEHRLAGLTRSLASHAGRQWHARPLVNGEERSGASTEAVRNPAEQQDVVGSVSEASPEDIADALATSVSAGHAWSKWSAADRAGVLARAADSMEAAMHELVGLAVREAGKSYANAVGEVREAVDFLRYYAAQVDSDFSNETHLPLGPVVCISPWNFPLAIFTGQVAAALAAGNAVLAKPAEQTPLIAACAVRLLHRAGIPAGALQLLPGRGEVVGAALVADERVRAVMFTGSTDVARLLQKSLAGRLDPAGRPPILIAETGGQNAMIVDSSALVEQVTGDVIVSAFDSAGQRCSALRVLCVQEDIADRVIEMIKGAMRELHVGRPDRLSVDLGPVIDAEALAGIERHVEAMRAKGRPVYRVALDDNLRADGHFVAPTLIELTELRELTREIFGPVLHVVRFRRQDLGALIAQINATGYGLTLGLHTRLDETIEFVTQQAHAGNLYVNRNMVGAVVGVQPFGGEGLSGTGPKAGGPLYLRGLLSECPLRTFAGSPEDSASGPERDTQLGALGLLRDWLLHGNERELAGYCDVLLKTSPVGITAPLWGPTGERNTYSLVPRDAILCVAKARSDLLFQLATVLAAGSQSIWLENAAARSLASELPPLLRDLIKFTSDDSLVNFNGVLMHAESAEVVRLAQKLASRNGPIVGLQTLRPGICRAGAFSVERLLVERSVSVNTAAAGGNASLMTIG